MSYKFNPFTYVPLNCAECGQPSDYGEFHLVVNGEARKVAGLYLCDRCDRMTRTPGYVPHVTPVGAYVWLTEVLIPRAAEFAAVNAEATGNVARWAVGVISDDLEDAIRLKESLAYELLGVPSDHEPEPGLMPPFASYAGHQADYAADAAEMAAALDFRREADGTVTYECPNPDCPEGNRHPMSFAAVLWDEMPIEFVNALQAHIPG